jgi:hypothetical protein
VETVPGLTSNSVRFQVRKLLFFDPNTASPTRHFTPQWSASDGRVLAPLGMTPEESS